MRLFKSKNKYYYCRFCGKRFEDPSMARLCFDLDIKVNEVKEAFNGFTKNIKDGKSVK